MKPQEFLQNNTTLEQRERLLKLLRFLKEKGIYGEFVRLFNVYSFSNPSRATIYHYYADLCRYGREYNFFMNAFTWPFMIKSRKYNFTNRNNAWCLLHTRWKEYIQCKGKFFDR